MYAHIEPQEPLPNREAHCVNHFKIWINISETFLGWGKIPIDVLRKPFNEVAELFCHNT